MAVGGPGLASTSWLGSASGLSPVADGRFCPLQSPQGPQVLSPPSSVPQGAREPASGR